MSKRLEIGSKVEDKDMPVLVEKSTGKEFKITPDIPLRIGQKFFDLRDIDPKNYTKQDNQNSIDLVVDILSLKNDPEDSRKFVENMTTTDFILSLNFITDYMEEELKSDKKKE